MPGLPGVAALATGNPLSALPESGRVAAWQRLVGVRRVRPSGVGDRRHDLHRTRTPLRLWFAAAWQMTSQKHGVSALGVQRSLGLGSYQTAWAMLHRYRAAMVRPGRERLAGHVEVDEAYVGGVESSGKGRKTESKAIVAIAVEIENPKGFGRIRLGHVADVSKDSLLPFIDGAVEPGSTVHTDGWQAYWTLTDRGYEQERTVMRQ